MFENILGLERTCDDLRRDVSSRRLPGAILLSGPRYNAKSSIALEVARVVSCRNDGAWNCSCHSCAMHRTLQHPNTVMIGPRYFSVEIGAAVHAFRRERRRGTAFLLIRSVRKLVRRFDPHLWQENRIKKALPIVEKLEEAVGELEDAAAGGVFDADTVDTVDTATGADRWNAALETITTEAGRLEHQLPHDPAPVDLVRAVGTWARISTAGGYRVVIIEEAHTLQDAARNAMLKILEEPPEDTLFILTTSRKSAIIPTIRSRVRNYDVPERSESKQMEVQRRIFRVPEAATTLREFFRRQSDDDGDSWNRIGRDLVDAIDEGRSTLPTEHRMRTMLATTSPRHGAEYILDAIEEEIRRRLRREPVGQRITRETLHRWGTIIRQYWGRIESRNMNPTAVLAAVILAFRRNVGSQ